MKQSEIEQAQSDLARSVINTVSESDRSDVSMVRQEEQRRLNEEKAKRARQEVVDNQMMPMAFSPNPRNMFSSQSTLPQVILPQIPYKMRAHEDQESARVRLETTVIKNLIKSYFELTKKNIADLVPKTIMAFLVNESRRIAQIELIDSIYKPGDFD